MQTWQKLEEGKAHPLGATWDGLGVNFAVFSANATRIELCLFDASGRREVGRLDLPSYTDEVFHGYLPHASPGLVYGYRAHGPYQPEAGHRFNPHKLLLDPYARQLTGGLRWSDAVFGYRLQSPRADLSLDRRDDAGAVPKGVVTDSGFSLGDDKRPEVPWSETVIYEAHVKGFTQLLDKVPHPQRGTFSALCHPAVIGHLKRLGVTTIELLPVHAFLQDRVLLEKGLRNYWGYNTLSYFAPEPRYMGDGSLRDIREMVRRYHAAGLEVILDVVYNHTCEGSEMGPTISWRGLDNASYYRLAEDGRHTINDTGTGNTLNISHPRVLQMVMDSLRYWAEAFHIDGFRFDLGLTLGRESWGFDTHAGFFDAIRQDPILSPLKLITEPWDVGPGGYQLGHFPPGFSEWNDRYRDGIRRYWRGDGNMRPEVAARLTGSGDLFDPRKKKPHASINYLASHDGFTLHDLVSYESKHNEANGEDNRDGTNENFSSNHGAEGLTDDGVITAYRERVKRAMLATLLGSQGTPMLLMGDECGRSQGGNNNAYCQDNEISWFDWKQTESESGQALIDFIALLSNLRRQHPTLRCDRYLGTAALCAGLEELSWWDERGVQLSPEDWENSEGRILIARRAERRPDDVVEVTALMMNADANTIQFQMPGKFDWKLLYDSRDPGIAPRRLEKETYEMEGRTVVLLTSEVRV
jgi:glycogen operon protein